MENLIFEILKMAGFIVVLFPDFVNAYPKTHH